MRLSRRLAATSEVSRGERSSTARCSMVYCKIVYVMRCEQYQGNSLRNASSFTAECIFSYSEMHLYFIQHASSQALPITSCLSTGFDQLSTHARMDSYRAYLSEVQGSQFEKLIGYVLLAVLLGKRVDTCLPWLQIL